MCVSWGYPDSLQAYLALLPSTKVCRWLQVGMETYIGAKGSLKARQKTGQPVLLLDYLWSLDTLTEK